MKMFSELKNAWHGYCIPMNNFCKFVFVSPILCLHFLLVNKGKGCRDLLASTTKRLVCKIILCGIEF